MLKKKKKEVTDPLDLCILHLHVFQLLPQHPGLDHVIGAREVEENYPNCGARCY